MCKMRQENIEQCKCLARLKGEVLNLIDKYGAELREIICDFEREKDRVPTGQELIWILCEHHGMDLTKEEEK